MNTMARNENLNDFYAPAAWEISEDGQMAVGGTYDVSRLRLIGWTVGDGTGHEGYHLADYFRSAGQYSGPDAHSIEPLVEETDD